MARRATKQCASTSRRERRPPRPSSSLPRRPAARRRPCRPRTTASRVHFRAAAASSCVRARNLRPSVRRPRPPLLRRPSPPRAARPTAEEHRGSGHRLGCRHRPATQRRGRGARGAHRPARERARRRAQGSRSAGGHRARARPALGSGRHTPGGRAPMRIWIDLSAPAHPVVFRPLVQRLRAAGHEVEVTARDFAQTLELAQLAGIDALAGRGTRRALGRRQAAQPGRSLDRALALGAQPAPLRPRRGPWLERPADRGACAAHPGGRPVRLRMGDVPAHDRLPARAPRDRARRDPAGAAAPLRRRARASCASTRGSRRSTSCTTSSPIPASSSGSAPTPRRIVVVLRTPPTAALYHRVHNPVYADLLDRLGKRPRRARRRPAAPARAGRRAAAAGAAIGDRARARGRRPEPGLGLRPRDLGRAAA